MAKAKGLSFKSVQRIWKLHGLKPHLTRTFKLSRDKRFVEKLTDIVGSISIRPKRRWFCVWMRRVRFKPWIAPSLGCHSRRAAAAPTPTTMCATERRPCLRRSKSWRAKSSANACRATGIKSLRKFLRTLDASYPKTLDLHLILDNYGTHKHAKVQRWLGKHPRFKLHFTPTSASWTNLVERWFRELSEKAIRRGVFQSVADLEAAIDAFLASHNQTPKPFVWTASVDKILAKLKKVKAIYDTLH